MAPRGTNIFKLQTFCLITGASKGLGRCMAHTFAAKFPKNSLMVLIARGEDNLNKTRALCLEVAPGLRVKVMALDLGAQDETMFQEYFREIFQEFDVTPSDFEQALLIHNAASIGRIDKKFSDIDNWREVSRYFDLNLTSVVTLNASFLSQFNKQTVKNRVIINISSICALQPFKTWSLYCASKAARDMFFRTMALEEPDIRILNYAPGPVDTDMQVEARTITADKELKKLFVDMKANKKLLTCEQSISKLRALLEKNRFDCGAHMDYYDLP